MLYVWCDVHRGILSTLGNCLGRIVVPVVFYHPSSNTIQAQHKGDELHWAQWPQLTYPILEYVGSRPVSASISSFLLMHPLGCNNWCKFLVCWHPDGRPRFGARHRAFAWCSSGCCRLWGVNRSGGRSLCAYLSLSNKNINYLTCF